ncbi:hypothetical protein SSBR45G_34760 [Bradyrhizobium sp. SSBR45G]|nr:hypothetical protein SSBR45G_34760 [Bradyrhizobium sp. SSBR45G]GLH86351.1 hypothetical protein SSBR45R_38110 [Bradyrhizobium sp. SSBR45R]
MLELLTSTLLDAPIDHTYGELLLENRFGSASFTVPFGLKEHEPCPPRRHSIAHADGSASGATIDDRNGGRRRGLPACQFAERDGIGTARLKHVPLWQTRK